MALASVTDSADTSVVVNHWYSQCDGMGGRSFRVENGSFSFHVDEDCVS